MRRPIPKIYATRFFQLITTRQFAEAERILERVRQKIHISERNQGYFQALCGMLLTQKSNSDRYAFLTSIDLNDKKKLRKYRQEFMDHAEGRLHAEYDRGFFEAWADFTKTLLKMEISTTSANNKPIEEEETESVKQVISEETEIKQPAA